MTKHAHDRTTIMPSNFDREQAQRLERHYRQYAEEFLGGGIAEFLGAGPALELAAVLESALALHDEHKKLLRELAELRAHPKVAHRLQQAAEHLKLKDEHERLKAAHEHLRYITGQDAEDSRDHPPASTASSPSRREEGSATYLPSVLPDTDYETASLEATLSRNREQAQEAMNLPVTSAQIQPLSVLEPDKAHTDKQLTGVHKSRPLSREAKEEALDYASWAGAIGAGVARRIKAGTDTDLEPKAAVTAFHHAIAARRLLDLDPEDA